MPRSFALPFLATIFLVAPVALPTSFAPATAPGFSGSAQAGTTVKSSKSNTSDRMGGGGGSKGTARTTTVKSSKSNSSDRMGGGGGGGGGATFGPTGIGIPGR